MQAGTNGRAAQPPTRKVAPSIYAPTRRVAPTASSRPRVVTEPEPLPLRPPTPPPGRRTGAPRTVCPGCQAVLPTGSVICVECGFCLTTGRVLRSSSIRSRGDEENPEEQVGFFKLGAGIFTKPVVTMDTFPYHAGRPDLLWKVGLFALFGILVSAFVRSLGSPSLFPAALGVQAVGFIVYVACLLMAGTVLGERSNFLGAAVGIGFVSACVQIAAASLLLGAYFSEAAGTLPPALVLAGGFAFVVWAIFLHVIAVRGVFACGTIVALGITFLAVIIDWFAWKAISGALHLAT